MWWAYRYGQVRNVVWFSGTVHEFTRFSWAAAKRPNTQVIRDCHFPRWRKRGRNPGNEPFFNSNHWIWYKRGPFTEITRKKRENYFKMRLNDRSRTWPPYLLCHDFENRWDRFGAAGHRPIGLFARKFAFCKDRSVFKTENDNAWVIYKMRWAYAVHSRDDRIENVNQGCPSPLLLLQLQLVWKLSTGVTSLG